MIIVLKLIATFLIDNNPKYPTEPPEPPANFRVLDTTSRSIRLQWRRPYDGNSPVLGYVVQYRRHDSANPDAWRDADTHNISVNAHTVDSYTE